MCWWRVLQVCERLWRSQGEEVRWMRTEKSSSEGSIRRCDCGMMVMED